MVETLKKSQKVTVEKGKYEALKEKAFFSEDLLEFLEDKFLGGLMEKTEKEENVSLSRAKKLLR